MKPYLLFLACLFSLSLPSFLEAASASSLKILCLEANDNPKSEFKCGFTHGRLNLKKNVDQFSARGKLEWNRVIEEYFDLSGWNGYASLFNQNNEQFAYCQGIRGRHDFTCTNIKGGH